MTFRVAVTNPFDLLSDENEDPAPPKQKVPKEKKPVSAGGDAKGQPAKKAEEQHHQQPKTGTAAKSAPAEKPKESPKSKPQGEQQQQQPKRKPDEAKAAAKPRDQQGKKEEATGGDVTAAVPFPEKLPRQRNRGGEWGRDREKGPRAMGDRVVPPRGRPFERRSGTGRSANENKKGGSGKANWGKAVGDEGLDSSPSKPERDNKDEAEAPAAEGDAVAGDPAASPKAKEPERLGLDEYLEQLKAKAPKVAALQPRQVVSNEDPSWSNFAPLTKVEDELAPLKKGSKKSDEKKENGKATASPTDEKKVRVDEVFQVQVQDIREKRGGREDRRKGTKAPRGEGKPRAGGKKSNFELKVDEQSFPALSGKTPASHAADSSSQSPPPVKA